ncbi:MAG: hypothetical protein ACUVXA_20645 [Candidatus Jordarchaeum sp.]|uniref:hypothetical protein n=1 Tax=Candidatus Jordarchaeum sp. TaxID=2823881 RepID=UPI004049DAEF
MNLRKLVRIILCTLLVVGPLMIPLTTRYSGISTQSQLSFTNYAHLILTQQNTPISSKDLLFVRNYSYLDTKNPLIIELFGIPQIESVNFSLSNIKAPNYTIRTAEEPEKTVSLWNMKYVMGFKINQTCYLHNISLFIIDVKKPFYLDFEIYNATWNTGTTRIEPNQQIYFKDNLDLQNQAGNAWKTITLNSALTLNLTETENQTFFIALSQYNSPSQAKELAWGYYPSIGENGYGPAYNWTSGTLEPLEFDFSMRVRVSASNDSEPEIVYPSQINLKINDIPVQNSAPPAEGKGVCTITGNFDSSEILILNFTSTWFDTVSFNASVKVYGVNLFGNVLMASLLQGYSLGSMFQAEDRNNTFLIICAVGAVAVAGFSGYRANKKRKIPINAMRSMESILVDHNPTGGLVWSFNFISMQQDTALVSGFMSAIKTFLEEMKVGGLKRLGTDFGTFIREESQLLTATCIAGEIGIDEEFWIRSKLHEFLVKVEQSYYKELQDWKGLQQ